MQVDFTNWLTKAQVAQTLSVSTKTVEKLAEEEVIQKQISRRPGKPAIVVYHPDDVERERKKRFPDAMPFVTPAGSLKPDPGSSVALVTAPATAEAFMAAFNDALRKPQDGIRITERHYLTLKQASELSGLSQAFLMRRIKAQKLAAIKDVSWKIRRVDLEKL